METPNPTLEGNGPACERCGRCLTVCPVYRDTGVETLSPRGRLDLIRAVAQGGLAPGERYREAIHTCLQCLACHDACPKGVDGPLAIRREKAALIRQQHGWHGRLEAAGLKLVLGSRPVLSRGTALLHPLIRPLTSGQNTTGTSRHLPLFLPEILAGKRLPDLYLANRADTLPEIIEPKGRVRDEITLFTGCFFGFLDTRPLGAAIRVLAENGIRVRLPRTQVCCGAPAVLSGHPEIMVENAKRTISALAGSGKVLTLCATCGNALTSEYPQQFQQNPVLGPGAANLSSRVQDLDSYLAGLDTLKTGNHCLKKRVTIHQPCHLNRGMKEGGAVSEFLNRVPGLEIVPLEGEADCCGGGGICALKNPGLSRRLGDKKAGRIMESGADMVTAPCPGCLLQIRDRLSAVEEIRGKRTRVPLAVHPVELAARTFGPDVGSEH